ncbi:MAG: hypothetical protein LBF41_01445 [Deltaproteobacteria bacterium]|jgi:hypothetical protein|nr:hypothetical protein [Deltaproteobacteria bacterium]
MKITLVPSLSLALLLSVFSQGVALAQLSNPNFDPEFFANKPPLTDKEVSLLIGIIPKIFADEDITERNFNLLAAEYGFTPDRLNYALLKTIFGVRLAQTTDADEREAILTEVPKPILPTDAELEVIKKRLPELTALRFAE